MCGLNLRIISERVKKTRKRETRSRDKIIHKRSWTKTEKKNEGENTSLCAFVDERHVKIKPLVFQEITVVFGFWIIRKKKIRKRMANNAYGSVGNAARQQVELVRGLEFYRGVYTTAKRRLIFACVPPWKCVPSDDYGGGKEKERKEIKKIEAKKVCESRCDWR
ncbi:hypothetical protein PUN28_017736 [Cardiocondyla obscurior]|uniref:Uncharacterized protein n=1 Tax=Cardiocondyla obscurior TaxID=286306 RepID=A0AAW2EP93_9HYME